MEVRYLATEMARRHLVRLHPVGVQIARAVFHCALRDMWRDGSGPTNMRYFLPLQLTDLPHDSMGGGWTGLHFRSRGDHGGIRHLLTDLVVEGRQWGYDDSQIVLNAPLPETTKITMSDDPTAALGLPAYMTPMTVFTDGEDRTIVRISQETVYLDPEHFGSETQGHPDDEPLLPLPCIGRRLAEIGDALGEQRVPFENALCAYRDLMDWYHERGGPWRLEEFVISREWMVHSRGADRVDNIDVKRGGGSMTPEMTPAQQTMHEMDELATPIDHGRDQEGAHGIPHV